MIHLDQAPQQQINPISEVKSEASGWGILISLTIIGLWTVSLLLLLSIKLANFHFLAILIAMFWQTFLYTGLFIITHDAMHGVVFPKNPKMNHLIGTVALTLYGLLSYEKLLKKHWLHHRYPATEIDPDFHDGQHKNPVAWYLHFMKGYWSWTQIIGLTIIFNLGVYTLHLPRLNLTLFWAIPAILSGIQLFYFGTFLPHHEPKQGYQNTHRAQTIPLPIFWSFITCYHFCYHEEHHEYPHLPWWQLPRAKEYRR